MCAVWLTWFIHVGLNARASSLTKVVINSSYQEVGGNWPAVNIRSVAELDFLCNKGGNCLRTDVEAKMGRFWCTNCFSYKIESRTTLVIIACTGLGEKRGRDKAAWLWLKCYCFLCMLKGTVMRGQCSRLRW